MKLELFQVDAFADEVFRGNPAAVVPLTRWLPGDTLQKIAVENQLSETAFFLPASEDDDVDYHIRWFTPGKEVDLCGHATVAAAHVLVGPLQASHDSIRFQSPSGVLGVKIEEGLYTLDFPARPGEEIPIPGDLTRALGQEPTKLLRGERDWMAVFESEPEVARLRPDMTILGGLEANAVIVTAPGEAEEIDFVSRFFAPKYGIPEDPATGSAHCTLIPYWAERLGKEHLRARQISTRGADLYCSLVPGGDRVLIGGHAVTYLEGRIEV